ncbi:MAG: hypothetical protein ACREFD_18025, partial [Stellaceae bacterium]
MQKWPGRSSRQAGAAVFKAEAEQASQKNVKRWYLPTTIRGFDPAHPALTAIQHHQCVQQTRRIQPIGLGVPRAPVDKKAGGSAADKPMLADLVGDRRMPGHQPSRLAQFQSDTHRGTLGR